MDYLYIEYLSFKFTELGSFKGLGKYYPIMSYIGHYLMSTSPNFTLSNMNKYLMLMSLVISPLEVLLLFSRSMELWLS